MKEQEKNGYLLLHRKILDWEWYDDPNTCRVFIHCLFKANWKPCRWHGVEIKAGQFITSLQTLAVETCLSVMQVRTALKHLDLTGEVTSKPHSKFRIITVNNWDSYQVSNKQTNKQVTNKQQADNKQVTTDEEYKEIKEINKRNIYGEYKHVLLTKDQFEKLVSDFGEKETLDAIKFLDEYIEMKGYKAKNHNLALRKWVFDAVRKEKAKTQSTPKPQNKFEKGMLSRTYDFSELEKEAFGGL